MLGLYKILYKSILIYEFQEICIFEKFYNFKISQSPFIAVVDGIKVKLLVKNS